MIERFAIHLAFGRQLREPPGRPRAAPRAELLHVLILPDFQRADRIGGFWSYPESRTFAELLIDCQEDRVLRRCSSACCGTPIADWIDELIRSSLGRQLEASTNETDTRDAVFELIAQVVVEGLFYALARLIVAVVEGVTKLLSPWETRRTAVESIELARLASEEGRTLRAVLVGMLPEANGWTQR